MRDIQSYLQSKNIYKKNSQKSITVVADAGMLNKDNINLLNNMCWKYIVGARLSNLQQKYIDKINKHKFENNNNLEIKTHLGKLLVTFSEKRYRKDKHDLDKYIAKAEGLIKNPSKMNSRYKYIKRESKEKYILNEELIQKRKFFLGLKGYYTNTTYSSEKIVEEYRNLWRIEQNFKVLKSDLACRPIYHWKPQNIQSHLLISFMALSISKYIEINNDQSIRSYVKEIMKYKTLELRHLETDQILTIRI